MTGKIGPSFAAELIIANVSLEGLSWDRDEGIILFASTEEQKAAARDVLARHDPSRPVPPSFAVLSIEEITLNMHGLGVLKAFIAAKCKATDRERWRTMQTAAIDDPVMLRMMRAADPVIDAFSVFNYHVET